MKKQKTLQDYYYESLALLSFYGVFDVSYSNEEPYHFEIGALNGRYNIRKPDIETMNKALLEFEENYPDSKKKFLPFYKNNRDHFNIGKEYLGANNQWSMLINSTLSIFHDNDHFFKLFFADKYSITNECLDLKNIPIMLRNTENNYGKDASLNIFKSFVSSPNVSRYFFKLKKNDIFQYTMITQFFLKTFKKYAIDNNMDRSELSDMIVHTLERNVDSSLLSFCYDIIEYNAVIFDDFPELGTKLHNIKNQILSTISPINLNSLNTFDYLFETNTEEFNTPIHVNYLRLNLDAIYNNYSKLLSLSQFKEIFKNDPVFGFNSMNTSFLDNDAQISFIPKILGKQIIFELKSNDKSYEKIDVIFHYVDDFIKKFYTNICYNNEFITSIKKSDLMNEVLKKQREITLNSLFEEHSNSPSKNTIKRKI